MNASDGIQEIVVDRFVSILIGLATRSLPSIWCWHYSTRSASAGAMRAARQAGMAADHVGDDDHAGGDRGDADERAPPGRWPRRAGRR